MSVTLNNRIELAIFSMIVDDFSGRMVDVLYDHVRKSGRIKQRNHFPDEMRIP